MANLYDVLEISTDASTEEIRSSYRRLVRKVHPDAGGKREDFKVVQDAYDTLSNPKKKKRYDASLKVSSQSNQDKGEQPPSKAKSDWWVNVSNASSGSFAARRVPDGYNDLNDFIGNYWSEVASPNIQPFGSQGNSTGTQRQTKYTSVLQKDIVGGKIERTQDDLLAQYRPDKYGYAIPNSKVTANIDVILNNGNDHLRTLLPGDRVIIYYNGIDIDMTLRSLSIKASGGGVILINMELEK